MNVLALIQTFCDKAGLPRPTALVGATDKSSRQYQALLRETVADLGEYRWQQQKVRGTFTSVAASLQGKFTDLLGAGYAGIVPDSMWNDTKAMRIFGPMSEAAWQAINAVGTSGPEYSSWISRDSLYVSPTMDAGDTVSVVYVTKYNIYDVDTAAYKESIDKDSDTIIFPDNVVLRFFEAKWRKQKGEAGWEDDYNDAMGLIAKNIVRDTAVKLQLDRRAPVRPGIIIPPGTWNV